MRRDVSINFGRGRTIELQVQVDQSPQSASRAREWLDATYEKMGCEPIRPSGKVLLIDKILAIAIAAGYEGLSSDRKLLESLASQSAAALDRARIAIDTDSLTVGF
jgi:hypothetical protein